MLRFTGGAWDTLSEACIGIEKTLWITSASVC